MYIYDLPYFERKKLCEIFDQSASHFEDLAIRHMQYDASTVQRLRREHSPTEELLTIWGIQNHTVIELFILLYRMKHCQAMLVLKPFVDEQYHPLIQVHETNLEKMLQEVKIDNSKKILNAPRPEPSIVSQENNESVDQRQFLKPKSPLPLLKTNLASSISQVTESAGSIPLISYEELEKSTNNWDSSAVLGRGGFGIVYKGTWKCTKVAIKRIELKDNNPEAYDIQIKQSITELHWLNAYRHDNILPLYGYSVGGPQPCLVYQYMSGGSLDHRLRVRDPSRVLQWPTRLNIAIGTARGLQFLHTIGEKPLIHGDIKSANILLDPNDTPRIGDFGLAREGPQSNYTHIKVSRIHGTRPYLPDEFVRAKRFSTKVDTYSFGVVLFEIATALSAYSDKRVNKFLRDHVIDYEGDILDLRDAKAPGGDDYFKGLIEIGKLCVNMRWKDRPEMVSVLIKLEAVM